MSNKQPLFTPDTMHDDIEQALLDGMNSLHITYKIQTLIKATREKLPNVYKRLAYIAHDCHKRGNHDALYNAIIIFTETLENIPALHEINRTEIPRFYTKEINTFGKQGWIWVDSHHIYKDSLIYDTQAEAKQAIDFLKQEIAELQAQLNK